MAGLGPWEVALICRIDDAVLRVVHSGEAGKSEGQIIPFSDGEAVRAFMTRLTIQRNAQVAAQKAKAAKGG